MKANSGEHVACAPEINTEIRINQEIHPKSEKGAEKCDL